MHFKDKSFPVILVLVWDFWDTALSLEDLTHIKLCKTTGQ